MTVQAPLWAEDVLDSDLDAFTPKHLREALAAHIALEGPVREGVVMDPADQREGESDGDFFHRLEREHDVDAYFIVVPTQTKVLGTIFEGGMLERDFHYDEDPTVLLFLQEGFARDHGGGEYEFTAKGKRTRYLETLAERAHHVAFWDAFEELLDKVLTWATLDP